VPKLIGDDDLRIGALALERAFTITPVVGPPSSRKGRIRFGLECEQPEFIDEMHRSALAFARKNAGKLRPGGRARSSFAVTFDAPRRDESFGELFATLALKLFIHLKDEFMGWQVRHHFGRAVRSAEINSKHGNRAALKLLHRRTR
jgi:hypothetical protein